MPESFVAVALGIFFFVIAFVMTGVSHGLAHTTEPELSATKPTRAIFFIFGLLLLLRGILGLIRGFLDWFAPKNSGLLQRRSRSGLFF